MGTLKCLLWPKNQFLFGFGFQNYVNYIQWVTQVLSLDLKKKISVSNGPPLLTLKSWELDRGENDAKDSLV